MWGQTCRRVGVYSLHHRENNSGTTRYKVAAITLLTPDQLAERSKPKGKGRTGRHRSPERTQVIEAYKAMMQEAQPGFGADVFLTTDETKRLVRQNLKSAAAELNLAPDHRTEPLC